MFQLNHNCLSVVHALFLYLLLSGNFFLLIFFSFNLHWFYFISINGVGQDWALVASKDVFQICGRHKICLCKMMKPIYLILLSLLMVGSHWKLSSFCLHVKRIAVIFNWNYHDLLYAFVLGKCECSHFNGTLSSFFLFFVIIIFI